MGCRMRRHRSRGCRIFTNFSGNVRVTISFVVIVRNLRNFVHIFISTCKFGAVSRLIVNSFCATNVFWHHAVARRHFLRCKKANFLMKLSTVILLMANCLSCSNLAKSDSSPQSGCIRSRNVNGPSVSTTPKPDPLTGTGLVSSRVGVR